MKRKKWMGSVFLQYVFSYFGIVLLSCAILGMVFIYSTIKAVDAQNRQVMEQKMELALQDLETQCNILEDIAGDILLHNEFTPSFFQESKFNEIELVESLGKYISYSPYTSQYFLLYSNSDVVYQSTGHTSYFSYYAPNILKTTGSKTLYSRITGVTHFTMLDYGDDELFLFAVPGRRSYSIRELCCLSWRITWLLCGYSWPRMTASSPMTMPLIFLSMALLYLKASWTISRRPSPTFSYNPIFFVRMSWVGNLWRRYAKKRGKAWKFVC